MADKGQKPSGIGRRKMLKKSVASGSAVGVASLSQSVVAWKDSSKKKVAEMKSAPEVRSIVSELGWSRLPNNAETAKAALGDSAEYVATRMELPFGTLMYGNMNGRRSAGLEFDTDNLSKAPKKYKNIPSGVSAWLVGDTNEAEFIREATRQERNKILSSITVKGKNPKVFTGSEIEGFRVSTIDAPENIDSWTKVKQAKRLQYDVEVSRGNAVSATSTTQLSKEDVTVTDVTSQSIADDVRDLFGDLGAVADDCGGKIFGCVTTFASGLVGCGGCAVPCAGSLTGVGAVLCFGCVFLLCSYLLTGVVCAGPNGALDCLNKNGYI
jgi:hypothetical protein